MAILKILTIPDNRLRIKAEEVTDFESIQPLINDMLETMYDTEDGIGLAATQVGRKEAVVVIDFSEKGNSPLVLVNPRILNGDKKKKGPEGCLSIPGYYAEVERFSEISVKACDRYGKEIVVESEDFLAIVMQHEIDHLNGTLFTDYLSQEENRKALKIVSESLPSSEFNAP